MEFTRHAKNRLRYLNVSPDEVTEAMTQPHETVTGSDGKSNALVSIRGMLVHIVYVVEDNDIVVITVWAED